MIQDVALFPLPEAVLFPDTRMPLHIFEPRYRKMTEDLLEGSRQLCIGHITEMTKMDANGHPPVARTCGIGEVVAHRRLPDGRFDIVVEGRARVQVDELPFLPPYRRVSARVEAPFGHAAQADLAALVYAAHRFIEVVKSRDGRFDPELPAADDANRLVDSLANMLIIDPADRQLLLETLDARTRVRHCLEMLTTQEAMLDRSRVVH